jgi:hypothetical protein
MYAMIKSENFFKIAFAVFIQFPKIYPLTLIPMARGTKFIFE